MAFYPATEAPHGRPLIRCKTCGTHGGMESIQTRNELRKEGWREIANSKAMYCPRCADGTFKLNGRLVL